MDNLSALALGVLLVVLLLPAGLNGDALAGLTAVGVLSAAAKKGH